MALMPKSSLHAVRLRHGISKRDTNEKIPPIKLKCRLLLSRLKVREFRFAHFFVPLKSSLHFTNPVNR